MAQSFSILKEVNFVANRKRCEVAVDYVDYVDYVGNHYYFNGTKTS